jgi:hypothetical protein
MFAVARFCYIEDNVRSVNLQIFNVYHLFSYRCRSMMLVGDDSPHIDDVVDMNGRMDPEQTDFLKVISIYNSFKFKIFM